MIAWWASRTTREKLLLGTAAMLVALAVIWQLVLRPAISTLETAKLNHDRAAQTLARFDRIETHLKQGEIISPEPASSAGEPLAALQESAVRMAGDLNLSVKVSQATENTAIRFQVNDAPSQALFKWVEQVETGLGLTVVAASLAQNPNGTLNAELEFEMEKAP